MPNELFRRPFPVFRNRRVSVWNTQQLSPGDFNGGTKLFNELVHKQTGSLLYVVDQFVLRLMCGNNIPNRAGLKIQIPYSSGLQSKSGRTAKVYEMVSVMVVFAGSLVAQRPNKVSYRC